MADEQLAGTRSDMMVKAAEQGEMLAKRIETPIRVSLTGHVLIEKHTMREIEEFLRTAGLIFHSLADDFKKAA